MHIPHGLKVIDIVIGTDALAMRGSSVTIRYTGYLNHGEAFQADMEVTLTLGNRNVITG